MITQWIGVLRGPVISKTYFFLWSMMIFGPLILALDSSGLTTSTSWALK